MSFWAFPSYGTHPFIPTRQKNKGYILSFCMSCNCTIRKAHHPRLLFSHPESEPWTWTIDLLQNTWRPIQMQVPSNRKGHTRHDQRAEQTQPDILTSTRIANISANVTYTNTQHFFTIEDLLKIKKHHLSISDNTIYWQKHLSTTGRERKFETCTCLREQLSWSTGPLHQFIQRARKKWLVRQFEKKKGR